MDDELHGKDFDEIVAKLFKEHQQRQMESLRRLLWDGDFAISKEEYAEHIAAPSEAEKDKLAVERLLASLKEKP